MSRCDQESGHIKGICDNLNQLIDNSKSEYRSIDDQDKNRLSLVLTWLDGELHSFFKEIGITPDILIPAIDEINKKIDGLAKGKNLEDIDKKIDDLDQKVNNINTETDKIRDLTKKGDIPDLSNLPQKNDLKNLVKKSDLGVDNESVDLKELAKRSDLSGLAKTTDLGGLAKKDDLNSIAKDNDLKNLARKINNIEVATDKIDSLDGKVNSVKSETDKIRDLAKTTDFSSLAKKDDLKDFATKADIPNISSLAEKNDLKDLVKKGDLSGLAKDRDLQSLAGKTDNIKVATDKIDSLDGKVNSVKSETDKIRDLAKTTDLQDLATKADIPDLSHLVQKNDLNNLSQQITNFAQQDRVFDQTITQEIKMISQGINIIPQEATIEFVRGNGIAGRYEAEIKLTNSNSKIGTFSPVGYYFFDSRIYVYDHLNPKVSIDLPQQYHFLKVVKTEEDKYKLAFCNSNGQEYYNIPDDYKLMNPVDIKSIKNVDFAKYYAKNGSNPSFIAKTSSSSYPNSERYGVDIYEISNGGKKVGSLIDEFGYCDSQNGFHYFNNHINGGGYSYNSPSFTINRGENECHLHKMQEGGRDIDLTHDNMACSLVEYMANYVNNEYFYH